MKIFLNEKAHIVKENSTAFSVRNMINKNADIVILNGFSLSKDTKLKEDDRLILIRKGQMPKKDELENFLVARHTPGVHAKVKRAVVGVAGLGGLGSNIAISLGRLGIGKLVLVDFDIVEPSNLNRQQYFIKHLGMKKTEAIKELLYQINPFVSVETKDIYLDKTNVEEIFKDVDIIVEAFDNPKSKAELINTALIKLSNKPIVSASGMAGYYSSNTIKTKRVMKNLYVVGDGVSEAKPGCGLMAPRAAIAANHQANMVLRIILGHEEV
ncbi:sulfur carrier protein ThiS adenylyltransferase ThiF [Haloimpatiens sp. FM7330]|uniref:sulfur carrier protein ThiS adenylyltransferase ThiF n=1 Tax=Haloimpatiens sp. FM7330 TaxID=3298610 RepID=UPI003626562E